MCYVLGFVGEEDFAVPIEYLIDEFGAEVFIRFWRALMMAETFRRRFLAVDNRL